MGSLCERGYKPEEAVDQGVNNCTDWTSELHCRSKEMGGLRRYHLDQLRSRVEVSEQPGASSENVGDLSMEDWRRKRGENSLLMI